MLINAVDAQTAEIGWRPLAIFRALAIVSLLILVFVPHMIFRAVSVDSPVPRLFLKTVGLIVGVDAKRHGQPLQRNVLYVANHVSWIDILALGGETGCAFVSKAEVKHWPVIGWLADQVSTVYVKREDRRAVMGQAKEVRGAVERGVPVALFPEGTTNDGITLKPFRASLMASMVNPPESAKVQPVILDYGLVAPEIAWTEDELAPNLKRVLGRKGRINLAIHFLRPLEDDVMHDRKIMTNAARDAIADAMAETGNTSSGRVRYRL